MPVDSQPPQPPPTTRSDPAPIPHHPDVDEAAHSELAPDAHDPEAFILTRTQETLARKAEQQYLLKSQEWNRY